MLERPLLLDRSPVVRNLLVVQMPDARYVGRVPLTLRPGDRLWLGLECLEDAIPLLLDETQSSMEVPSCRPLGRASM
jgi:hypothetical protein